MTFVLILTPDMPLKAMASSLQETNPDAVIAIEAEPNDFAAQATKDGGLHLLLWEALPSMLSGGQPRKSLRPLQLAGQAWVCAKNEKPRCVKHRQEDPNTAVMPFVLGKVGFEP